jgi:cytidine deaminase
LKKIKFNTIFHEYESIEELATKYRNLVEFAWKATNSAYAPYSNFFVGAAILLDNGRVVEGSNQENAAFPSGICAERVAVFAASTIYPGVAFKAIAITAKSGNFIVNTPAAPCGSCRQALSEYEHLFHKPIKIILTGETGKIIVIDKVEDILPLSFNSEKLNNKTK